MLNESELQLLMLPAHAAYPAVVILSAASDSTSYTCSDLLALEDTVNLKDVSESDAAGCALRQPAMSARVELKATNASTIITTVVLKYLEKGPATPITVSSARGDANITAFRAWRQTIRTRASSSNVTADMQPDLLIWQPRGAMIAFTRLAGAAVITIPRLQEGSDLLLLSVDVTEGPLPPPEMQAALTQVADPGEEPLLGTEVEIPEAPTSSFGNGSDMVSAQSFGSAILKAFSGTTKAWKKLPEVYEMTGYISDSFGRCVG